MKIHDEDSNPGFAEMIAKKRANAELKFNHLRSLSDEDRLALNERSAEICEKIASDFSKKSRRLIIS